MAKAGLKLKIFGNVQGVNFRYYGQQKALEIGLTGWVKNISDRTVECLTEGEEEDLKKFLDWCYNGPKWANVNKVEEEWLGYTGKFDSFDIIY